MINYIDISTIKKLEIKQLLPGPQQGHRMPHPARKQQI